MPIGSIFLGLALVFGVGLFITRPLWLPERSPARPMTRREALDVQKAALLDEIRALEFDYETGKLPEEEFQPRREELVRQTADILRQMDQLGPAGDEPVELAEGRKPAGAAVVTVVAVDEAIRADIESAILQLKTTPPKPVGSAPQMATVAVSAGATAVVTDGVAAKGSRFCSQCGKPREAGDKFCAFCGQKF